MKKLSKWIDALDDTKEEIAEAEKILNWLIFRPMILYGWVI